jgi:REP element-mobilizing transposase RayT
MEERPLRGNLPLNGRKPIRLPRRAYESHDHSWHIVLSVKPSAGQPFSHAAFATRAQETIVERCGALRADLLLACVMPDHVHLLLAAGELNLLDVVSDVKSNITRSSWPFGFQGSFWQRRFYDHGIRGDCDFQAAVTYILENPVEAELVEDWTTYPWLTGNLLRQL